MKHWREWAISVLSAVPPRPGMVIAELSDDTLRYWLTRMLHEGWRWRLAAQIEDGRRAGEEDKPWVYALTFRRVKP